MRAAGNDAEYDAQHPRNNNRSNDLSDGDGEGAHEHPAILGGRSHDIAGCGEYDLINEAETNNPFPQYQGRDDRHNLQNASARHGCASAIRCQMRLRMLPNASLPMMSSSRGGGNSIAIDSRIRPGRGLITSTRSER